MPAALLQLLMPLLLMGLFVPVHCSAQALVVQHARLTGRCVQDELGGAGVYHQNLHKRYLLEDDSWKQDIVPEIMDGHNVLDFVDPDIEARLEALEREEETAMAAAGAEVSCCMVGLTDSSLLIFALVSCCGCITPMSHAA